jgi:hypothetical protein
MTRYISSLATLALIGTSILAPISALPQAQTSCDSSGNKMVAPYHAFTCPVSGGLLHSYSTVGFWNLYSATGTLLKFFDAYTIQNTKNAQDGDCGPNNTPDSTGYASDSSGEYIKVTNYINWGGYVYAANGSIAYGPFNQQCSQ